MLAAFSSVGRALVLCHTLTVKLSMIELEMPPPVEVEDFDDVGDEAFERTEGGAAPRLLIDGASWGAGHRCS